jgi:hypothetical protein
MDRLEIEEIDFKEEYYDILNIPFYCSDNVQYGHNCWLAQALPQLNQKNKIVRHKIMKFFDELYSIGIKCLRIDAASHIEPKILKFYCSYFKKLNNYDRNVYIYSEVINPQGISNKFNLFNYVSISHITEYNLLNVLSNVFCYDCNLSNLNVLNLPSGDIGSVVFSTTHDLEKINGQPAALSRFGKYSEILENEKYKIKLITCYLLQRIYNVPLIFKTQIEWTEVIECLKFRNYLFNQKCNSEHNEVVNNVVFISKKYSSKGLTGIFLMNISDKIQNILIDELKENIQIKQQSIVCRIIPRD